MELETLQESLHQITEAASSIHELAVLLQLVDISDLKKLTHARINEMDLSKAISVHHRVQPINKVFPEDVMQHTLKFMPRDETSSVCKQWNRLSSQNERIQHRLFYQEMAERYFNNETSRQLWVMHPTRTQLNDMERGTGCRGVLQGKRWVLPFGPHHVVLAPMGTHCHGTPRKKVIFSGITFVGMGRTKSKMTFLKGAKLGNKRTDGTVSFENLHVELAAAFHVRTKLIFRNCDISLFNDCAIVVERKGDVLAENCRFYNQSQETKHTYPLVSTTNAVAVTLRNNRFLGFKYCLEVLKVSTLLSLQQPDTLRVTVVDNVVKGECGVWECPIVNTALTQNGKFIPREWSGAEHDLRGNVQHSNTYKGLCSCVANKK